MQSNNKDERFVNPIDKDHTTETPNTIAYPHHRGSQVVKPEDMGKMKSRAYLAMEEQTQTQLKQIYEQIEILAKQARAIQNRVEVSTIIYRSEMKFEPLISKVYHLYDRKDEDYVLAVIGPDEWGKSKPYETWVATVKLLADHTWEVISVNEDIDLLNLNKDA